MAGWKDILRASQGQAERRPLLEQRAGEPDDTLWLRDSFLAARSAAGETVTVERALGMDAVLACIRVLSDSVAALPCRVYQRQQTGAVSEQWSSWQSRLLRDEPNPEMTGAALWGLVAAHLNGWGNAYLGKAVAAGATGREVTALWPINPSRVRVGREGGVKVFYVRSEDGATETRHSAMASYARDSGGRWVERPGGVIHIPGFMIDDGLVGRSPIELASTAIGAGLAMDQFQSAFYRNNATPPGTLNHPQRLSETAASRLAARWRAMVGGPRNAGKVPVLEEGLTFTPIAVSSRDAEFVEARRLTGQQVCRIFRVPPEMIGMDSGNSLTYSTVEGQGIAFERYSIRPWLARIEQAVNRDRDLFPGDGRGMFCEFDTQSLLRADLKTRYEAYALALDPAKGWLLKNEVRVWERLPADAAFDVPAESPGDAAAMKEAGSA